MTAIRATTRGVRVTICLAFVAAASGAFAQNVPRRADTILEAPTLAEVRPDQTVDSAELIARYRAAIDVLRQAGFGTGDSDETVARNLEEHRERRRREVETARVQSLSGSVSVSNRCVAGHVIRHAVRASAPDVEIVAERRVDCGGEGCRAIQVDVVRENPAPFDLQLSLTCSGQTADSPLPWISLNAGQSAPREVGLTIPPARQP